MKKKIIIAVLIAIILIPISIYLLNYEKEIEVSTSTVVKGNMQEFVEELGTVKIKNHEAIYSPVTGKITDVFMDVGQMVEAGNVLVKLDDDIIGRQISELNAQRSAIAAQYNQAKEPVDEKSIEIMEIGIRDIENRVKTAEENAERNKMLFQLGAISNEEYQTSIRNLDLEKSSLEKAVLDLEVFKKPISSNLLAQYTAQLKQIDIQKANLNATSKDFSIRSNTSGTVLQKMAEVGSFVHAGDHLMDIGNLEELYIESEILVGDINKIKEGQEVLISNDDLEIIDLKGTVTKIHPIAHSKVSDLGVEQKRVRIEIEMDSILNLKAGYDLDLKIILKEKDNTLLIPENAVFDMDNKKYVFVNQENIALLKEIKTGLESERNIEVLSGLKEGDLVILSPDNTVEEGVRLK